MFPAEVRYLDIKWSEPDTVLKLECSRESLEIHETSSGWTVETTTFPSVHHYIGVRVKDDAPSHTPYFELADGTCQELSPVNSPGGKDTWWIQSNDWYEEGKRYHSELYRTAGRASLVIQNKKLTLENNTFNFSVEELDYYLSDFKNNLWMLILEDNSVLKSKVAKEVPDYFNNGVLNLFHGFIDSVEKLIDKPGMYLSEARGRRPVKNVKPVPGTFREYAAKPLARALISRTYRESYDTPDNRYMHYCVKRVRYILKSLARVAEVQLRSCEQKIEQEAAWQRLLGSTDAKRVDSHVYDNEISDLEQNLADLKSDIATRLVGGSAKAGGYGKTDSGTYTLMLGQRYGRCHNAFFANKLNGDVFKDKFGTYLVVVLPPEVQIEELGSNLDRCEISIAGDYIKSKRENSKGNVFYQLAFLEIFSASLVHHPMQDELARLKDGRCALESRGWRIPYSRQELEERANEIEVAERKSRYLSRAVEHIAAFSSGIPALSRRMQMAETFFVEHGVKQQSECPNSMIFVQNPSYASAKSHYRKIGVLNGLNESILNSLTIIDEIGLVNISNLYEKWCLLQIIKVLTQTFGFSINDNWQATLLEAVLTRPRDVEFQLKHTQRRQNALLTYEKVLESQKRPDFVLDLVAESGGQRTARLIIDAKFRGAMTDEYLRRLVEDLYKGKNYSEGGKNPVFVMHPTPDVINDRTSPLDWGAQCDYGQSRKAGHNYGAIFVSPSLKYFRTFDHLQRLLGLFLQSNSAIHLQEDSNRASCHNMGCVSCGNSSQEQLQLIFEPTKAGNDRWVIKCNDCGQLTVQTSCSACGHRLYKNGPKWTYHRTRAEQLSNVVCPKCGTFL